MFSSLLPLLLAAPLPAQTGTLDQVSPFGSEVSGQAQSTAFNFHSTSLTWQAQTEAGFGGVLEGFELELTGGIGGSIEVAIHLGSGWQGGAPAWSGTYAKTTSTTEVAWVDCSTAGIVLTAGDPFLIEVHGTGGGVFGTGTTESPANTLYTLPVYLNGSDNGDEARIGFHTYLLDGPSLSSQGSCGGPMDFLVGGATPGGTVAYLYARNTGSFVIPGGSCSGVQLGLASPVRVYANATADASGKAQVSGTLPSAACGLYYAQAVDVATCATTNVILVQ